MVGPIYPAPIPEAPAAVAALRNFFLSSMSLGLESVNILPPTLKSKSAALPLSCLVEPVRGPCGYGGCPPDVTLTSTPADRAACCRTLLSLSLIGSFLIPVCDCFTFPPPCS